MAKDVNKSIQWLEAAVLGGCPRAITGCRNIYDFCNREMTLETESLVQEGIPRTSKEEMSVSLIYSIHNAISQSYRFLGTRLWVEQDETAYSGYISSPIYKARVAKVFFAAFGKPESEDNPYGRNEKSSSFDFELLEGYDRCSIGDSGLFDKALFIESVLRYQCVEKTDCYGFTLLQRAAAEGNLALASTMIVDLGAEVDGVGKTLGTTPLWISCFTGNIQIARFLASHGADVRCKDEPGSRTILHLLNKCSTDGDLTTVLTLALRAGLDLDVRDDNNHTPLLSTFIGWDFSRGLAARRLIELKPNVLVTSKTGFNPFSAAVGSLDVDIVRRLCGAVEQSMSQAIKASRVPDLSPGEAKLSGCRELDNHTEFYNTRLRGRTARFRLREIVHLLLDESSMSICSTSDDLEEANPLIKACALGNEDLAAAILESKHCPDLDEVHGSNSTTALHWSIERNKITTSLELLRLGANPFVKSKRDYDSFQIAAIQSPSLLVDLLNAIKSDRALCPGISSIRSILRTVTENGYCVFALMVIEGSPEHLKAAEYLRVKYALPFDDICIFTLGRGAPRETLTACLVEHVGVTRHSTLPQLKYLFNLEPRPRLLSSTDDSTLLHRAVQFWHYGEVTPHHLRL